MEAGNFPKTALGLIIVSVLFGLVGRSARGGIVHESATMGPPGASTGWGLENSQFIGSRFHIDQEAEVTAIGGHLMEWTSGNLFGAIVALSSSGDLPNGSPFTVSEVAASTVFDPGVPSSDFRTPVSVTLRPGYYALIFGTDELGATDGEGVMPYEGQSNLPGASYILWDGSGWYNTNPSPPPRFVVEGEFIASYCTASGGCGHEYIKNVVVGDISNTNTGCDNYSDHTSMTTVMEIGTGYTITVTNGDPYYMNQCGIWVDWNQDKDFDDAGETISVAGSPGGGPYSATITPPVDAALGTTRMRVRIVDDKTPVSCGTTGYGEVEDYAIIVTHVEKCAIEGVKFHDLNGNGIHEASEIGLEGWKIYIDLNKNGKFDVSEPNTITGPSGHYEFRDLEPGSHTVAEVLQNGWGQTLPGWTGGRLFGSEFLRDAGSTNIVEINPGDGTVINSFSVPQRTLGYGLGGVAVGPTSLFFANAVVDVNGVRPVIWELDADTGTVFDYDKVELETDYFPFSVAYLNGKVYMTIMGPRRPGDPPPTQTEILVWDPVQDQVKGILTVDGAVGDGLAGDPDNGVLLATAGTAGLDKVVWIDPDTGEILREISHDIIPCILLGFVDGVIIRSRWSSPFTTYLIDPDSGEILDSYEISGVTSLEGLGGDGLTSERYKVKAEANETISLDFGNVELDSASIRGIKWNDLNANGIKDDGEPGLEGWTIYIDANDNGRLDAGEPKTATDSNGEYEFTNLPPSTYVVSEAPQCKWSYTGPFPASKEFIDITEPRDLVFDRTRNILYISTGVGTVERYELGARELLDPFMVGVSLYGMDITPNGSVLYVTEGQPGSGHGILHKVNLNTGAVTNISYGLHSGEKGGWDIQIGSYGKGLMSAQYDGSGSVPFRELNLATDSLSIRTDIPKAASGIVNNKTRILRSADRSIFWMVGTLSNAWIFTYNPHSDTFTDEFNLGSGYLGNIPFALNFDGRLVAYQKEDRNLQVCTTDFRPVTALKYSRAGTVFDSLCNRLYMASSDKNRIIAIDTKSSSEAFRTILGMDISEYQAFITGEMAVSGDGRFAAITTPTGILLVRIQHEIITRVGRTFDNVDFGNKRNIPGDFDGDQDIDTYDLVILSQAWLTDDYCVDISPAVEVANNEIVNLEDFAILAGNWLVGSSPFMEFDEDFETGDFSKYLWTHEGQAPWKVVSREAFEGQYCAQSDERLPRYTETALKVTLSVQTGRIKFFCKTGSRDGGLKFYVDDLLYGSWDYDEDWALQSFPVVAGNHTFKWEYRTGVFGDMCAWVDGIKFPPANEQ